MASERFIRWQAYTISQLTFALNLFLGLSVGLLAFVVTLLRDETFLLTGLPKLAFFLCLFALCISFISGCGAVISRLLDFRFTARKIRSDEKGDPDDESGVYRYRSKYLGYLTWRLFWTELFSFIIGVLCLIVAVISAYSDRVW